MLRRKYIAFSIPIKKELDNGKTITYKPKLIDSFKFMSSKQPSLVDNLSQGFHDNKCKESDSYHDYICVKDEKLRFKCFNCGKKYKKSFNKKSFKNLIKNFSNTCDCCSGEDIIDADYRHAKRAYKKLNNKNLGDYHDLYVQGDTLILADIFENFRNKYIEMYELDPAHFLSAPGLAWKACLKRTGVKLELLTDNNMLNMTENGIRGGMCGIHRYAKSNNKYIKNYNKNKDSSYLMYLDANNLYGQEMSQNLLVFLNGKKHS